MLSKHEKRQILKNYGILLFFMIISILLLFFANSKFIEKVKEFGLHFVEPTTGITFDFKSKKDLLEELNKLKIENITLLSENYQLQAISSENKRLKKLYNIADRLKRRFIYAKVIGRDHDNLKSGIIIKAGTNQDVKVNDPVISENGLVGYVKECTGSISTVKLINSSGTNLPVYSEIERIPGILKPINFEKGNLQEITKTKHISLKEKIFTSSYSTIYPEHILVGFVSFFSDSSATIHKNIKVKYSCNFEKLTEIFVLKDSVNVEDLIK